MRMFPMALFAGGLMLAASASAVADKFDAVASDIAAHTGSAVPQGASTGGYLVDDTIGEDFADITTSGTLLALGDDQVSAPIPIGFTFTYFGTPYTDIFVSSNGFLTVLAGQSNGCCTGGLLPDPATPNGVIAGWWEDLNPGAGGSIHYQLLGSAPNRIFIVQFTDVPHFGGGNLVTMQWKLFEGSSNIEVHYLAAPSDGGTHTAGIENEDGTEGIQYYRGVAGLETPLAVCYTTTTCGGQEPPPPAPPALAVPTLSFYSLLLLALLVAGVAGLGLMRRSA